MIYDINPEIILERICGVSLLIATQEGRKTCPYIVQLNDDAEYIWRMLIEKKSVKEMTDSIMRDYDIPKAEALERLNALLKQMEENHYIQKSQK